MDCIIGEDLKCVVCGKAAPSRNIFRNCGEIAVVRTIRDDEPPEVEEPLQRIGGPGTELKKLLAKFGIVAMPGCSCNEMAARMDAAGPDGSRAMIDEVLDVMKQEAGRRGLPWVEMAARVLVKRAIRNARARK